jgi:hypothetical protein
MLVEHETGLSFMKRKLLVDDPLAALMLFRQNRVEASQATELAHCVNS